MQIIVGDKNVISAAEELTIGSGTPTALTLQSVTRPDGSIEQQVPVMTLQPAEVRIFRFKITHPTASAQLVAAAQPKDDAQITAFGNSSAGENVLRLEQEIFNATALKLAPNPATDVVTASLELPTDDTVSLMLYDMHGRAVGALAHARSASMGRHEIQFSTAALPSGVYVCVMQTATTRRRAFLHIIR